MKLYSLLLALVVVMGSSISTCRAARLWQSGWETGDAGDRVDEFGIVENNMLSTTTVRSGNYARVIKSSLGGSSDSTDFSASEIYTRFYVYITSSPSTTSVFYEGMDSAYNGILWVSLNTNRTIQVRTTVNGVQTFIANSSDSIPLNTWTRIEIHFKVSPSLGICELRMDGVAEVSASNLNTGIANVARVQHSGRFQGGVDYYFDDSAVNDTIGSVNNSWPGDGSIVLLTPNTDVSPNNWTANGGGAHFAEIDDFPGLVNDTTYIKTTSKTFDLEDQWGFSSLPPYVSANATINAICFGVRGGGTGTTGRTAMFQAQDTGGNVVNGANVNWNINGFKSVYPILSRGQTWDAAAASLTVDYVNSVLGSAVDTNTSNKEIRWSSVWESVEYVNP